MKCTIKKTLIILFHEEKKGRELQGTIAGGQPAWKHHLSQLPNTASKDLPCL